MNQRCGSHDAYKKQGFLTRISILGEIPNFLAVCFCYFSTGAILLLVDLIDTGSNLLRNVLVSLVSRFLGKDQRFRYNYGNGKIEAMTGMACDLLILFSLLAALGVSVHDIFYPQPPSALTWIPVCLKAINLTSDIVIYIHQWRISRISTSEVIQSSLRLAWKNLCFDSVSMFALLMMAFFRWDWVVYVSPVFSIVLSAYLFLNTVRHIPPAMRVLLDKTVSEDVQMDILKALVNVYDQYEMLNDIRSHVVGDQTVVDLELGFPPQTTYEEMRRVAETITLQLSEKIGSCKVSLIISNPENKASPEQENAQAQ